MKESDLHDLSSTVSSMTNVRDMTQVLRYGVLPDVTFITLEDLSVNTRLRVSTAQLA